MSTQPENPSFFQSATERRLRDALRPQEDTPASLARRRRLLANAFRVTRSIHPAALDALATCQETLGYGAPVELFVSPEPGFHAAAVSCPPESPAIVVSARLLEAFTEAELRFVLGHELGHLALGHLALPLPAPGPTPLDLYRWSRVAEVSADRAGLLCARDVEAAASALLKRSSGLSSVSVKAELKNHQRQVDALLASPEAREQSRDDEDVLGCFDTHSFGTPRVRALVAFAGSRTFRRSAGSYASEEGLTDEAADTLVARDLEALGTEDASPDADSRAATLGLTERARRVLHLTLRTSVAGSVTPESYAELRRVAESLSVPPSLIDEALRGAASPLD